MVDITTLEKVHGSDWQARGYHLSSEGGKPVVSGETGEFYCDAVANAHGAAKLMEHLRSENPDEYSRYREDAADDGIDLDESQDVFVGGSPLGWA